MTIAKNFLAAEEFTRIDTRKRSTRGHSLLERMMNTCRVTETGCRVWTGAINHGGYGVLLLGKTRWLVHRLSWIYHNGRIPDGQVVRHKICGNTRCFEITHLELGTQAENVADTVAHGKHRVALGMAHVNAKVTDQDVLAIRASEEPLKELSARYGISLATVHHIQTGKIWKHIGGRIRASSRAIGARVGASKLTDAIVRDIRTSPDTAPVLAQRYGVSRRTIGAIRQGRYWKHVAIP